MTITESNIVLNHTGERIISADSHVAITQDQVKANLDPTTTKPSKHLLRALPPT